MLYTMLVVYIRLVLWLGALAKLRENGVQLIATSRHPLVSLWLAH